MGMDTTQENMGGAYWPIDCIQKARKQTIVAIAKEFAMRGLSLRVMANDLDLNYSSLKRALRLRNYSHPTGIALVSCALKAESNIELDDYLKAMISKGESRNVIAKDLGVDNKTLQNYANKRGYVFPDVKPIPKDFTNIIAAIHRRKRKQNPVVESGLKNGIQIGTIKKRIALGWNENEIIGIPSGEGHLRRCPLKAGQIVTYVGQRSKTLSHGEVVKIVGGISKVMLIVESVQNKISSRILRKNIAITTV